MSGVSSTSGTGGLWSSLKSIFSDTQSKVKADLKSGQTQARTQVQTASSEVKTSAAQVKSDVSALRKLIDEWV